MLELHSNNVKVKEIWLKDLLKGWEDAESVPQYHGLPFLLEIIRIKLIKSTQ